MNTSKSEVVHFNSAGEMFLILMLAVPPFISHKGYSRHLGMIFYRTFNMAKSAEHVSRPFLASAYRIRRSVREHTLTDHRPHTTLFVAR